MEPRPVPEIIAKHPHVTVKDIAPPPGAKPDECGTANMAAFWSEFMGQEVAVFTSYYQPTKEEIDQIVHGAYIGVQMIGIVVPHSLHVQALDE
jgi:hypothetical protein